MTGSVRSVDFLCERVADVYEPGRDLSVDEAMIPFKGRSSLKQYMPLKPVRRGIKVWARADSSNGYVSAFQIYTGKQGGTGLGAKVVKGRISRAHADTCTLTTSSPVLIFCWIYTGMGSMAAAH